MHNGFCGFCGKDFAPCISLALPSEAFLLVSSDSVTVTVTCDCDSFLASSYDSARVRRTAAGVNFFQLFSSPFQLNFQCFLLLFLSVFAPFGEWLLLFRK